MLEVIILAAGHGSRMQSSKAKVLHLLAGQPLVCHVLAAARQLGASRIHVVVGHDADAVQGAVAAPDVQCHLQQQQLGTGHAVQQAIDACEADSTVLVLFGDVPSDTGRVAGPSDCCCNLGAGRTVFPSCRTGGLWASTAG